MTDKIRKRIPGPGHFLGLVLPALLVMTLPGTPVCAQIAPVFPAGPGGVIMMGGNPGSGISDSEIADFKDKAGEAGWSDADITRFVEMLAGLTRNQLPARLVLDRARQGLVKGALPDRIRSVCGIMVQRLEDGGRLVDGRFPEGRGAGPDHPAFNRRLDLIDRTAFALEKGVPDESVRDVFTKLHESGTPEAQIEAMGAPVLALASLTSEGVPPPDGVDFVTRACGKGVRGKDLENLGQALAQAIHGVEGPDRHEIVRQVLDNMDRGIPPGQIIRDLNGWRARGGEEPPGHREGLDRPGRGQNGGTGGPPVDPGRRGHGGRGGRRGH